MKRHLLLWFACVGALAALVLTAGASAGVSTPTTCTGTFDSPGELSGSYSNVAVRGFCSVSGSTTISGHLTLNPGSTLAAIFAGANLTVAGNVDMLRDATLFAGCNPDQSPCLDDASGSSTTEIGGSLLESRSLGAVLHGVTVDGNVIALGGGGGVTCDPVGIFAQLDSPAFSAYESMQVGGSILIAGYRSCWLGVNHNQIDGSVALANNDLADPDAIEVLDNTIGRNLVCFRNSMVWDSADITEELYPRMWEPNTVEGKRAGQCVVAPPIDSPTGVSPGAF